MAHDPRRLLTSVLLDTNIWNDLATYSNANALAVAARRGSVRVVAAPAAVYESLAYRDAQVLRRRADLLTDSRWKRLMPEAYSETEEVLREVRRLRPEWLLDKPPTAAFQLLFRDWRRNRSSFWTRARETPERVSSHVNHVQGGTLTTARKETRQARDAQVNNDFPPWDAPLNSYLTEIAVDPRNPTDAITVSPWRRDALDSWTQEVARLDRQPSPLDAVSGYIDWLCAEVDFAKVIRDGVSWRRFWLVDIDEASMPRRWLRWSAGLLQQFSRWTKGTPGDNQIATYLQDAEVFVTADRGFHRIVEKLKKDAPFPIAAPVLMPADQPGVSALLAFVERGATYARADGEKNA